MRPVRPRGAKTRRLGVRLVSAADSGEPELNGQTVLRNVVSALESIDPEDRFCPFCYLLLRIVRRFLKETPEPGSLKDKLVEVVDQPRISDRDHPEAVGPVLPEVVGVDTQG